MKKIILAFTLLLFNFIFSQSTQFIYEYTFIKDSTDRTNQTSDFMILNVEKHKSEYFSAEKYLSDSTLAEEARQGKFVMPPNKEMINDRIVKKLPSKTITHITRLSYDKYEISQTINFNWTIESEVDTILNHKVQKATTIFGGRKWTAWFSKEIPINDGPYKFFGLPGLILKIEDVNQNHLISLIGVKNSKNNFAYSEFKNYEDLIKTTYDKYKIVFNKYRKDPAADMIGKIPDQTDWEGNFRTGEEIIRENRKLMLARIKKDNNLIELDLIR